MSVENFFVAMDSHGRFAARETAARTMISTTLLNDAIRADGIADLMRKLGPHNCGATYRPVLVQQRTEIISQHDWLSGEKIWE